MTAILHDIGNAPRERAIIIAVVRKGADPDVVSEHLDELELLLDTAGADVALRMYQERDRPDGATCIGKGKLEELRGLIDDENVQMVVFDDELSPVQVRNLEKELNVKILDRTGVILDIFASHAKSLESRTQVELAQLEYLMPRLTRMWTHLSKQYGGVGTKGPGETQIETDRRMFRTRIQRLKEKLAQINVQRSVQRKGRENITRCALVGYTNAGKSSLMRALTNADVLVEDRLFATLDTTVRALDLPSGKRVLLSDTVGFIRKLPPQLVASFRTTLAEAIESDIIIHVVDAAAGHSADHIMVVNETLKNIGITHHPTILVFNKIDCITDPYTLMDLQASYPDAVFTSALTGFNLDALTDAVQRVADTLSVTRTVCIPYSDAAYIAKLYRDSEVLSRTDDENGTTLQVKLTPEMLATFNQRYSQYLCDPVICTTQPTP